MEPWYISSGENLPPAKLTRPEYLQILLSVYQNNFDPTDAVRMARAQELCHEGLLKRTSSGGYADSVMVIRAVDGEDLFALAERFSRSVENIILRRLPEIQRRVAEVPSLKGRKFTEISFFVLSDVLLDNWQIRFVEKQYLNVPRPSRGGKNYYMSLREKAVGNGDPFGIYGNSVRSFGKILFGFYGNTLGQAHFENKKWQDLSLRVQSLGEGIFTDQEAILNYFIAHPERSLGLESEGLGPDTLILTEQDEAPLDELSRVIRADLIAFLQSIDAELRRYHKASRWASVEYSEFFIWWYHFLYTRVTDHLAKQGVLSLPASGRISYLYLSKR